MRLFVRVYGCRRGPVTDCPRTVCGLLVPRRYARCRRCCYVLPVIAHVAIHRLRFVPVSFTVPAVATLVCFLLPTGRFHYLPAIRSAGWLRYLRRFVVSALFPRLLDIAVTLRVLLHRCVTTLCPARSRVHAAYRRLVGAVLVAGVARRLRYTVTRYVDYADACCVAVTVCLAAPSLLHFAPPRLVLFTCGSAVCYRRCVPLPVLPTPRSGFLQFVILPPPAGWLFTTLVSLLLPLFAVGVRRLRFVSAVRFVCLGLPFPRRFCLPVRLPFPLLRLPVWFRLRYARSLFRLHYCSALAVPTPPHCRSVATFIRSTGALLDYFIPVYCTTICLRFVPLWTFIPRLRLPLPVLRYRLPPAGLRFGLVPVIAVVPFYVMRLVRCGSVLPVRCLGSGFAGAVPSFRWTTAYPACHGSLPGSVPLVGRIAVDVLRCLRDCRSGLLMPAGCTQFDVPIPFNRFPATLPMQVWFCGFPGSPLPRAAFLFCGWFWHWVLVRLCLPDTVQHWFGLVGSFTYAFCTVCYYHLRFFIPVGSGWVRRLLPRDIPAGYGSGSRLCLLPSLIILDCRRPVALLAVLTLRTF
jgi:hypothetical protein